jgi:uncharacterized protein YjbI with pentapeptide repeats
MANMEHVARLRAGIPEWNEWRRQNPDVVPDLSAANLRDAQLADVYLGRANLANADLSRAILSGANLGRADMPGANLSHANLYRAILSTADITGGDLSNAHLREAQLNGTILDDATLAGANLRGAFLTNASLQRINATGAKLIDANLNSARLIGADLTGADLKEASLRGADLSGATMHDCDLERATLVDTRMVGAQMVNCSVYGVNAWNVDLTGARQDNLILTPIDEPVITVDDLEVAQFIYLLLNNQKIRNVLDTVTAKAVLILGRFTPERKLILDALRKHLREHDLLPILFDFDRQSNRTLLETVSTLARMSRFVIADITDPKSIPQELAETVKTLPSVPVQPILQEGFEPWGMFESVAIYPWVLKLRRYRDLPDLITNLSTHVILPAEQMAMEMAARLRAVRESLVAA